MRSYQTQIFTADVSRQYKYVDYNFKRLFLQRLSQKTNPIFLKIEPTIG